MPLCVIHVITHSCIVHGASHRNIADYIVHGASHRNIADYIVYGASHRNIGDYISVTGYVNLLWDNKDNFTFGS